MDGIFFLIPLLGFSFNPLTPIDVKTHQTILAPKLPLFSMYNKKGFFLS